MTTEEQIVEMSKICCDICEFEHCGKCLNNLDLGDCYMAMHTARKLYNAGYQKVSEVVAKIFTEIEQIFSCGSNDELRVAVRIAELRKKYEREGAK